MIVQYAEWRCERCGAKAVTEGQSDQPRDWSTVRAATPPLSAEHDRMFSCLLCSNCTLALAEWVTSGPDATERELAKLRVANDALVKVLNTIGDSDNEFSRKHRDAMAGMRNVRYETLAQIKRLVSASVDDAPREEPTDGTT